MLLKLVFKAFCGIEEQGKNKANNKIAKVIPSNLRLTLKVLSSWLSEYIAKNKRVKGIKKSKPQRK